MNRAILTELRIRSSWEIQTLKAAKFAGNIFEFTLNLMTINKLQFWWHSKREAYVMIRIWPDVKVSLLAKIHNTIALCIKNWRRTTEDVLWKHDEAAVWPWMEEERGDDISSTPTSWRSLTILSSRWSRTRLCLLPKLHNIARHARNLTFSIAVVIETIGLLLPLICSTQPIAWLSLHYCSLSLHIIYV